MGSEWERLRLRLRLRLRIRTDRIRVVDVDVVVVVVDSVPQLHPPAGLGLGDIVSSVTGIDGALYPLLLGEAWAALGEPVRRLHAGGPGPHRGTFTVTRGTGVARWLATMAGMPAAGEEVPVTLELGRAEGMELWRRSFAGRTLITAQYRDDAELVERFGPIACRFRLEVREGALWFVQTGASLCLGPVRLPLPRWGSPRVVGMARAEGERVRVQVTIAAPLAGLLVDYRGEIAVGDGS